MGIDITSGLIRLLLRQDLAVGLLVSEMSPGITSGWISGARDTSFGHKKLPETSSKALEVTEKKVEEELFVYDLYD